MTETSAQEYRPRAHPYAGWPAVIKPIAPGFAAGEWLEGLRVVVIGWADQRTQRAAPAPRLGKQDPIRRPPASREPLIKRLATAGQVVDEQAEVVVRVISPLPEVMQRQIIVLDEELIVQDPL